MVSELKELTSEQIELVAGGDLSLSPAQVAAAAQSPQSKNTETPQVGALLSLWLRTPYNSQNPFPGLTP